MYKNIPVYKKVIVKIIAAPYSEQLFDGVACLRIFNIVVYINRISIL